MSGLDTIINALKVVLPSFNNSDGTIENKIINVVGTYADTETLERSNTLDVINKALEQQKVTGITYYRRKAVAFQLGDMLLDDPINQGGYYAEINAEKQIVKQAYIIGNYPDYTLLVNAIGDDGHLRPLTTDELNSFRTYFAAFQPLGMQINIASLSVAQITTPNLIIYVRPGVDAGDAAEQIQANLLAYESTFRTVNTVSITEIVDVIQQYVGVVAVSLGNVRATEVQIDGTTRTIYPENDLFDITNGAFSFATPITTSQIQTLQ